MKTRLILAAVVAGAVLNISACEEQETEETAAIEETDTDTDSDADSDADSDSESDADSDSDADWIDIEGFDPTSGSIKGGTEVTLTGSSGSDLNSDVETVLFGEETATIVSSTHTTVVVLTPPADTPGIVDVTIWGERIGYYDVSGGFTYQ